MAFSSPTLLGMLLWLLRTFVSSLICLLIGFLGLKILDYITVDIREYKTIKGKPVPTAHFVGGFILFTALIVHGSATSPIFLGQSLILSGFINLQRLFLVILSTLISLLFGWLFYYIFAKVSPFQIDLDDINQSPEAIGIFLFTYEVFLGLIIHATLTMPF
jgi:uncharacterized membrane protein YjfL (UPF0719 family)